ncbi:hypothetical protein J4H92_13835 [Leucobacter weissii]|uniref:DUF2993 domain-containing protein n=1 Tax=Leucobacter weissii TaxID=1983706 RepID=A0A939MLM3_9MICO|nr:LmeA family phospholipid-binding protein [Leucobacter weissii]MBO1903023.1 hypothetical protein [Leucobacter weissii]
MGRWLKPVVVSVVVLALIVGAAELALRLIVPGVVAAAVRQQLELSADHPVEVSLGGFATAYAVTGRLGQVTVAVEDVEAIEDFPADLLLSADAVPFDLLDGGELSGARAEVTVGKEQLPAAISLLTGGAADSGKVQGGELVVGRTAQMFGTELELTVDLALAVEDGDVLIEPTGISAAGFDLSTEQIREAAGDSLDGILTAHTVCVRDRLPAGVELTGVRLSTTGSATIEADLSPTLASDPAQRNPGTC